MGKKVTQIYEFAKYLSTLYQVPGTDTTVLPRYYVAW
jgi:hypothetical protein